MSDAFKRIKKALFLSLAPPIQLHSVTSPLIYYGGKSHVVPSEERLVKTIIIIINNNSNNNNKQYIFNIWLTKY